MARRPGRNERIDMPEEVTTASHIRKLAEALGYAYAGDRERLYHPVSWIAGRRLEVLPDGSPSPAWAGGQRGPVYLEVGYGTWTVRTRLLYGTRLVAQWDVDVKNPTALVQWRERLQQAESLALHAVELDQEEGL